MRMNPTIAAPSIAIYSERDHLGAVSGIGRGETIRPYYCLALAHLVIRLRD